MVTFTDGLDNVSIELNTQYRRQDEYLEALNRRINNVIVQNRPISAYSIGIRGGDISDADLKDFYDGLAALANPPVTLPSGQVIYYNHNVNNMTEVNTAFRDIANDLYRQTRSQSIELRIPGGYTDGTRIRFTFDNVRGDPTTSNMYIEGTYRRDLNPRMLENVVYHGITSTSGTTITGRTSGVWTYFEFPNISTPSGDSVPIDGIQEWRTDNMVNWRQNSEFDKDQDMNVSVEETSAIIMLVLDCTTSLDAGGANGFAQMKAAAINFINILVDGQQR